MKSQETLIWAVIAGVCIIAFVLPILLIGERIEERDDIILASRYTATATPLDRVLTREAFALLFFSPTSSLNGNSSSNFALTLTPFFPVTGLTTIPIPTLWGATFTPTATQSGGFGPSLTPTWTLTLSPTPTYTLTSAGTQTLLSNTHTPAPTITVRPSNTVKPTNTVRPPRLTNTPRPSNTPRPPRPSNTPKPKPNSTPTP